MPEKIAPKRTAVPPLLSFVVLIFVLAAAGWWIYSNRPCSSPITYRLGTFDTGFGISQADFLADAAQAASIWNQAEGKTALVYSATGKMPVNLIYDSRQQLTQTASAITQSQTQNEQTKAQLNALEAAYTTDEQNYTAAKQLFEQESSAYNSEVQTANAAGGATPAQAESFDTERAKLQSEQTTLNAQADALNQQQQQLQTQTNTLNAAISSDNAAASTVNKNAGTDFEEGEYVNDGGVTHIDIYQYENKTQLIRLIAHEFGHSLGLGHDTNSESIMYPYNIGTSLSLSTEDQAELTAECSFPSNDINALLSLIK
jgi:predicted Zn-dependent protease